MIRFRLFLCIWLNASIFSVSSEEVSFARFMADWSDFSVFPKLVKDLKFIWESKLKALWKLLVTHQVVANFLIHLIKLIATLPKPLGFKCNPSLFSSFEVIFPLSIILYYKVVVIVNKRTPPLSLQRMQLIAASVRTFKLNRHHGVFKNYFWTFTELFSDTAIEKNIFMPNYMAHVTFPKNIILENFRKICIATNWKMFSLKNIRSYRFCC